MSKMGCEIDEKAGILGQERRFFGQKVGKIRGFRLLIQRGDPPALPGWQ